MRKLAVVLALVLLVVGIFGVAALTDVVIDRDVEATITGDIDDNAAVKFSIGANYGHVVNVKDGADEHQDVEFLLGEVLDSPGLYFNTQAEFQIGDAEVAGDEVFSITNQLRTGSDIEVKLAEGTDPSRVDLVDNVGDYGTADLDGFMVHTIDAGETTDFHFELDTSDQLGNTATTTVLDSTMEIRLSTP